MLNLVSEKVHDKKLINMFSSVTKVSNIADTTISRLRVLQ